MKRKTNKNTKKTLAPLAHHESKHSFLFWLVVPLILVWLSVGYLMGVLGDKPIWFKNDNTTKKVNPIIPYYQTYGSFSEQLDQPFVTLWFDDAWLTQYTKVYPILHKYNMPGTIAVPVNSIETPNYMNWAQLQTVQRNNWEVTNHSLQHDCQMDSWGKEQIQFEYKNSKYILWKNKLASDIFVTPCGTDSKIMRDEAAKTFVGYRTVDPGFNDPKNFNNYDFKVQNIDNKTKLEDIKGWIDEAKEKNLWVILVFHKVGESTGDITSDEYNTPLEEFKKIVEYVKKSNIKVVTPSQMIISQNPL